MSYLRIRAAAVEDAAELLEIYKPYVEHTAITFEYEVPSVKEFAARITKTLQKYPYLVAEYEGRLIGYAYAGAFKERAAYECWQGFICCAGGMSPQAAYPECECLYCLSGRRG